MINLITSAAKRFFIIVFGIYLKNHKFNQNSLKTISLYSEGDDFVQAFTKIRFWDAPYAEAERLLPKKGVIIDVGCGEGLFTNFLAISETNRKLIGIDIDKERLKEAQKGLSNTEYRYGDIKHEETIQADAIVMMHVLHHLTSREEQNRFILNYSGFLKKNGVLLIGEVEPKFSFKYFITWCTDHFLIPILFEKRLYSPIFFRPSKKWKELLENTGFSCNIIPADSGKPFTHVIIQCKKN